MANKSFASGLLYKFVLNRDLCVHANGDWEINISYSSNDEWELPIEQPSPSSTFQARTYAITKIGVDSQDFYYVEEHYTIDVNGQVTGTTTNTVHVSQISGDFIIEWIAPTYYKTTTLQECPDVVFDGCFVLRLPIVNGSLEHVKNYTVSLTNYDDNNSQPQTIILDLYTDNGYRFNSADVTMLVEIANQSLNDLSVSGYPNGICVVNPSSPYYAYAITRTLVNDTHVRLTLTTDRSSNVVDMHGDQAMRLSYILGITVDITTSNVLIQSSGNIYFGRTYGVTLSSYYPFYDTQATYEVTITAISGYTLDDVYVSVKINDTEIPNAYNPNTHKITVGTYWLSYGYPMFIEIVAKKLNNYTFYKRDGGGNYVQVFTTTATSLSNIKLIVSGGNRTLSISGVSVATWNDAIPDGYESKGLSLTNTNTYVQIPSNILISRQFDTDTNFYEVILPILETSFELNTYTNNSPKNEVSKDIVPVSTLSGVLREECSVINPVIKVSAESLLDFNYVYIPSFKRFYYVNETRVIRKGLWELYLTVDTLMSFQEIIRQQTGYILRNEYFYDEYKVDNYISLDYNKNITFSDVYLSKDIYHSGQNLCSTAYIKVVGGV